MRPFLVLLLCLLPCVALAQDDPLTVTLPGGKVGHFQTAEAKAQYEAALMQRSTAARAAADAETARAEREREQIQANQAAARKPKLKTIREISTDVPGFLDRHVLISGTIDVSSYFNWAFRDSEGSLYAFTIRDGTGGATVYVPRGRVGELRNTILHSTSPVKGTFEIVIPGFAYERGQQDVLAVLYRWDLAPAQ